jgi:hypothetical protein
MQAARKKAISRSYQLNPFANITGKKSNRKRTDEEISGESSKKLRAEALLVVDNTETSSSVVNKVKDWTKLNQHDENK